MINIGLAIGLAVLGFILGFLFTACVIVLGVHDKRIVLLFSGELKKYEAVIGVTGNKGKILWRFPVVKNPGDALIWSVDIDLDEWK